MKIIIANKIYIEDAPQELISKLKEELTLKNQQYVQMKNRLKYVKDQKTRMRCTWALKVMPEYYRFFKEENGIMEVGRGCLDKVIKLATDLKIEIVSENKMVDKNNDIFLNGNIKLRDYQMGVPEEILENNQGIIKLSTGFGKSLLALKLIEILKIPTLIICHQDKEVKKYIIELKNNYNYQAGVIQGNQFDVKEITIASISTLIKRDLSDIKNYYSMVIVDECQLYVSEKRLSVIQNFNPKYLYGMSGTPERDDGLTDVLHFTFGDIIIDKQLPQMLPEVKIVKNLSEIPLIEGEDYSKMVDRMIVDEDRNKLIMEIVVAEKANNRKILILTKRVAHYQLIAERLEDIGINTIQITSGLDKIEQMVQDKILARLAEGKQNFDVILGTYSMLAIGANFPALDTLIFAGDLRSKMLNSQAIGRILRIFQGKQSPKVIDIDDQKNPILHHQACSRRSLYNKNKWHIY